MTDEKIVSYYELRERVNENDENEVLKKLVLICKNCGNQNIVAKMRKRVEYKEPSYSPPKPSPLYPYYPTRKRYYIQKASPQKKSIFSIFKNKQYKTSKSYLLMTEGKERTGKSKASFKKEFLNFMFAGPAGYEEFFCCPKCSSSSVYLAEGEEKKLDCESIFLGLENKKNAI